MPLFGVTFKQRMKISVAATSNRNKIAIGEVGRDQLLNFQRLHQTGFRINKIIRIIAVDGYVTLAHSEHCSARGS